MRSILLYDLNLLYQKLFFSLKNGALSLLPAILLVATMFSYFFGMDFAGIFKRFVLALIAITIFNWMYTNSATLGFSLADSILSKNNHVLKSWTSATKVRKEGFNLSIRSDSKKDSFLPQGSSFIDGIGQDIFGFLIWLLANFALWFVKVSFTIAYYLPLITIPIVAIINIFPFTSKALDGAIFSMLWIAVTPVVIAVLIEILNAIILSDEIMTSASWISKALMSILFALYLVSSFSISSKMMGTSGISEGIIGAGHSYGMGMVSGVVSSVLSKGRMMGTTFVIGKRGATSPLKKMTLDPLNKGRELINTKSNSVLEGKDSSAIDIVNGRLPNLSRGEKALLFTNKITNPYKSFRDHRDRKNTAVHLIANGQSDMKVNREEVNINRLRMGKSEIGEDGKSIKLRRSDVERNTFIYDKKFWVKAPEEYRHGIKRKYGIPVPDEPRSNFKYYPKNSPTAQTSGYLRRFEVIHPKSEIVGPMRPYGSKEEGHREV